ncbi:hypothetical protein AaE_014488 [Aphanomyces astaci]|uniref:VPS37 C-terminal domain-containing protein n=1 Tax=Aphanomyces astaci TaxID=112090 RepID=A0A6A4YZY3_APHAT|nr:hypothetical protein AaE_014488 [Aphanomyces astaci]
MSSPSMPPAPITTSASATPMYPGPTSASPLTPSYLQSFPPHATSHQHSQQPPVPSLYPPYPSASTASPSTYGYPAPYATSSAGASYGQGNHQQQPPKPQRDVVRQTQSPAIPTVFPELESLSVNQLEKLVTDRATLKAYIKSMDNVVNFMKLYDDLYDAPWLTMHVESNLGYEAQLAPLQSDVQSLKQQLHQAQESLHAKQTQQRQALVVCSAVYLHFQAEPLVARVAQAADEVDEASEEIAARFTNGEIDVSQFVTEFLPTRKLYHLRTTKVDRFTKP